jgi:hypothetical protein
MQRDLTLEDRLKEELKKQIRELEAEQRSVAAVLDLRLLFCRGAAPDRRCRRERQLQVLHHAAEFPGMFRWAVARLRALRCSRRWTRHHRQLLAAYFGMTPQAMRPLPPPFSGLSE